MQITQIGRPICKSDVRFAWFANRTNLQIGYKHIFRAMMQPVLLLRRGRLAVAVAEKTITKMNPCFQSLKRLFACSPLTCFFANSNKLPLQSLLKKKGANVENDGNLLFQTMSNDLKKSWLSSFCPWKCSTSRWEMMRTLSWRECWVRASNSQIAVQLFQLTQLFRDYEDFFDIFFQHSEAIKYIEFTKFIEDLLVFLYIFIYPAVFTYHVKNYESF